MHHTCNVRSYSIHTCKRIAYKHTQTVQAFAIYEHEKKHTLSYSTDQVIFLVFLLLWNFQFNLKVNRIAIGMCSVELTLTRECVCLHIATISAIDGVQRGLHENLHLSSHTCVCVCIYFIPLCARCVCIKLMISSNVQLLVVYIFQFAVHSLHGYIVRALLAWSEIRKNSLNYYVSALKEIYVVHVFMHATTIKQNQTMLSTILSQSFIVLQLYKTALYSVLAGFWCFAHWCHSCKYILPQSFKSHFCHVQCSSNERTVRTTLVPFFPITFGEIVNFNSVNHSR